MKVFARWRGRSILTFAVLFVTLLNTAVSAQEVVPVQEAGQPSVAVYVAGDIPNNEKKVLGTYLLKAVVKAGQGKIADDADAFLDAATADEHAKGGAKLSKTRICELGKQFNIRYICVATVTQAFDFFAISTRMVDTETEEIIFKGEAQSHLKTINDLTHVSNQIVESMFGINLQDTQTAPKPASAQNAEPAIDTSTVASAPASDTASPPAVSLTGDAKATVDRVVAAVNAFKDATTKSIDAANAVKTAAQSKNYSAIMDAKKKVTAATEALKKAKVDVTAAIDALNSAGPESQAAVKAMGIDLSMFGGKGGGAGGGADNGEDGREDGESGGTQFYFTPKYQSPVGTPVSWGGVNAEIGWIWRSGAFFGIDFSFGTDGDNGLVGWGLSLGKEYNIGKQMQIVCGVAGGFWLVGQEKETYIPDWGYEPYIDYSYNFLAPFVKYRVSDFEITYRGLMGIKESGGFGYNSHQTMVGYQFCGAMNKPKRSDSHPSGGGQTASGGEEQKAAAARKTKSGFSLGYVLSGEPNTNIFQIGFAQSRPIGGAGLSFAWESNLWGGWGNKYSYTWEREPDPIIIWEGGQGDVKITEIFGTVGLNVPLLAQFDWSVLFIESGAQFDLLYRIGGDDYHDEIYDETIFNAGFVAGGGLSLGLCRLFYRFSTGTKYYSQVVGVRLLF